MKREFGVRLVSVIVGFVCIAFFSSVAAYIQAYFLPESDLLFDNKYHAPNTSWLLILKLLLVLFCCFLGGYLGVKISNWENSVIWISVFISLVISYLWYVAERPFWFWALLFLLNYPFVSLGKYMIRK